MYLTIALSGCVDLARVYVPSLPSELASLFLSSAFFSQGFILVFHLTGPELDKRLHAILACASFGACSAMGLSGALPHSMPAAFARCVALLSLGSFWIHSGDLMFKRPAFDTPEGVAIAPALFVIHVACWSIALMAAMLGLLRGVALRAEEQAAKA
jgi:hypothetical protein